MLQIGEGIGDEKQTCIVSCNKQSILNIIALSFSFSFLLVETYYTRKLNHPVFTKQKCMGKL